MYSNMLPVISPQEAAEGGAMWATLEHSLMEEISNCGKNIIHAEESELCHKFDSEGDYIGSVVAMYRCFKYYVVLLLTVIIRICILFYLI
jgi:hypothetical protein